MHMRTVSLLRRASMARVVGGGWCAHVLPEPIAAGRPPCICGWHKANQLHSGESLTHPPPQRALSVLCPWSVLVQCWQEARCGWRRGGQGPPLSPVGRALPPHCAQASLRSRSQCSGTLPPAACVCFPIRNIPVIVPFPAPACTPSSPKPVDAGHGSLRFCFIAAGVCWAAP